MNLDFLKNKILRYLKNYLYILIQIIKLNFKNKNTNEFQINFITERKNWSIKWDGEYIKSTVNKNLKKDLVFLSNIPTISNANKIYHFGSQYMWLDWHKILPKKNKYIVSFLHGKPDDSPEVKKHIEEFLKTKNSIFKIITASSLVYQRLLNWGVEEKKISLIPIGVDTNLFNLSDNNYKSEIRSKLGFKKGEFVIGSFQKDGIGWSKGLEPKLIKGPDLFVKAVELISKELEIAVLLTGPSRGYVKKELTKRNIKFKHIYIDSYIDIAKYYQALDLYIVSSREEGGPKAIVESMASGVPIISTDVGMARDFLINNYNGAIIKSFDYQEIAKRSIELLIDPYKKEKIKNAREDVMRADWNKIDKSLWENAYLPAIKEFKKCK